MQQVQLYIENQRVELFDDEIISLTQSIQNIKDPSKIFTGFTKQFNLPATKSTNKLFKHYYNFDITGGYDARVKTSAFIELNHKRFQTGKIRLQGVKMKNNIPYSYKIVFYGDLVEIKDLIGEDELSDLSWLDNFQKIYSMEDIKDSLRDSSGSMTYDGTTYDNVMRTSLIDTTKRLYYDPSLEINGDGNLYYHSSGHTHGVLWSDLKYSMGIHMIVKAIENKYNISFSRDWFNDNNIVYNNLFMFMHRKKGKAQPETDLPSNFVLLPSTLSTQYDQIAAISGSGSCPITDKNGDDFSGRIDPLSNGFEVIVNQGVFGAGNGRNVSWGFAVETTPQSSDSNVIYTVEIYHTPNGGVEETTPSYSETSLGTGSNSVSMSYPATNTHTHGNNTGSFRLQITSSEPITFNTGNISITGEFYWSEISPSFVYRRQGSMGFCIDTRAGCNASCNFYTDNDNSSAEGVFEQFQWIPTQQLPKMKIMDFLTGLFRLWNLTAYYDDDIVKVEPLDNFYGISDTSYELDGFTTPSGWSYSIYTGLEGSNASTTAVDDNFFNSRGKYEVKFQIDNYQSGSIKLKTERDESLSFSSNGVKSVILNAETTKLEISGNGFIGRIGIIDAVKTYRKVYEVYDISKYIDVNESTVSNGLPYKQIDISFKGHGSLLAKKFEQVFNRKFGDLEYTGDLTETNNWAGTIYKLEVPFEKMVFERLFEGNTSTQTEIQVGNMIDDNLDPYIGLPLLHFMSYTTGVSYGFLEDTSTLVELTSYNAPLNTLLKGAQSSSINFYAEFNEWTAAQNPVANEETLFKEHYKNYMQDVFNEKRRITTFNAWLPLRILLNYNLGDRFKINENIYRINSIKTNLQTGKSELELLNDL